MYGIKVKCEVIKIKEPIVICGFAPIQLKSIKAKQIAFAGLGISEEKNEVTPNPVFLTIRGGGASGKPLRGFVSDFQAEKFRESKHPEHEIEFAGLELCEKQSQINATAYEIEISFASAS
jgi:hypothetical protein